MNYLTLVNDTRVECGVSSAERPLTVLTGSTLSLESVRIKGWVDTAWVELQTKHPHWQWMWEQGDAALAQGVRAFAPLPTSPGVGDAALDTGGLPLARFDLSKVRFYSEADGFAGEQELTYIDYANFYATYLLGSARLQVARPCAFTVDPKKRLLLSHLTPSDEVLHLVFEFWRGATHLVSDLDVPAEGRLEEEFHKIIVYRAMEHYAGFDAASEVYQRGREKGDDLLSRLESQMLPEITYGPPLA